MCCVRVRRRRLADVPSRRRTDGLHEREARAAARHDLGLSHAAVATSRLASWEPGHGAHARAGALRDLHFGGRRCSLLHEQGRRPDRLPRRGERQDAVGVRYGRGRQPHSDVLRGQGLRRRRRWPRLLPRCQDRQDRVGPQGRPGESLALLLQSTDVRVDRADEHLCRQGRRLLRLRGHAPRRHVHHGVGREDGQDHLEERYALGDPLPLGPRTARQHLRDPGEHLLPQRREAV